MKEKKIRKTWKGILCLVVIVMMLCGSTMVFAETGELTTQCIDANAFISDPWGTVGNAISNGISNGVNALRYGDLYRRYGDFSVTLQMGNGSEVIGPNTIVSWIRVSDNGNEYYDDGKLNEYASNLAAKYNSTETKNTFMTSYGYEISIPSTTYSWVLNQQATANAIRNVLYAHQTQTIYPVWAQTAGNASTYVEISLTNQRLFLYKDGQQIMATDVVTGNTALGRGTPAGYYTIKSKSRKNLPLPLCLLQQQDEVPDDIFHFSMLSRLPPIRVYTISIYSPCLTLSSLTVPYPCIPYDCTKKPDNQYKAVLFLNSQM